MQSYPSQSIILQLLLCLFTYVIYLHILYVWYAIYIYIHTYSVISILELYLIYTYMWTTTPITIGDLFPTRNVWMAHDFPFLKWVFFSYSTWIHESRVKRKLFFFHRIMLQVPKMKCSVSVGIFVLLLCFALTLDIWILIVFLLLIKTTTVGVYIPCSQESTVHLFNSLTQFCFFSLQNSHQFFARWSPLAAWFYEENTGTGIWYVCPRLP